ncbi:Hypothetical_protein [Hexamita inflata]|uniref:Hypothetical_protein n=1 Tax=Hexamita inflata TaxID=28002 RepID=A0AA86QME5_9EUKA|nr:Hypothetical protein HINF_LOCUS48890 [Hexamita inflata]
MKLLQKEIITIQQQADESDIDFTDNNLVELVCNQIVFVQIFDISSISQTVSGFSGKYAISNDTNSAFINLSDNVLNSVTGFQIFQTQRYFYNVKIQIGTQQVDSGSILTDQQQTVLNQVSILSKVGTNLLVNSGSQLNIIHQYSNSTSVRNLLVNLLFSSSSVGNITLVGTVNGVVNVKNYQILGQYYSSNQMCLGALIAVNSKIIMSTVNYSPDLYFVGNQSSYFFVFTNLCNIQMYQVQAQVGSSENQNLLASISNTKALSFMYAGFVTLAVSSTISFKGISISSYIRISVDFVLFSGIILGYTSSFNQISIQNICVETQINYNPSSLVNQTGLIGMFNGNISIQHSTLKLQICETFLSNFGLLGRTGGTKSVLNDIQISFQRPSKVSYENEANISVLIGCTIQIIFCTQ